MYFFLIVGPVFVEEIGFPDIMLPIAVKSKSRNIENEDESDNEDVTFETKFISTHSLHAKRKEQYNHLRNLDRTVVKCQSIQDRGMFRDKRVESIERKLQDVSNIELTQLI